MPSSGQRWAAVIVVSSGQDRRIQIQGIQESGVRSQDAAPPPQRQPRPGRGAEEGADHGEEAAGLQGQHHPEGEHTLAQLQRGSCLPSPPSVHFMTATKARLLTPALHIYVYFQSAGYFEEAPKVVRAPVVKRPPPPSPSPASVEKASNPIALRYWNQCHGADRKISEPALLSPRWRSNV